jgi:hypothetical protein
MTNFSALDWLVVALYFALVFGVVLGAQQSGAKM